MTFDEFEIGMEFVCGDRVFRCTDKGTRTVIAIRVDQVETETLHEDGRRTKQILSRSEAEEQGWFNGPPYAVAELVFDEYDLETCEITGNS
jgi:hypothetical protein